MKKKKSIISGLLIAVSLLLTIGCDLGGSNDDGDTQSITYTIGDTGPSGVGIVFYVSDGGLHGYEVAPVDQSTSSEWSNNATTLTGTTGTAIGTGFLNTDAIINQSGHTISAAQICRNYRYVEEGDWFLPSKDELGAIWDNLVENDSGGNSGVGGFANDYYWSSAESSSEYAWGLNFDNGYQNYYYKVNSDRVRAVRAF